jgi:hypothetical protein
MASVTLSDVETSVLLGVPDGPVDVEADLVDVVVSRIGGLLYGSSIQRKVCNET